MQECITKTITEIDSKIATLTNIRQSLVDYFGEPSRALPVQTNPVRTTAPKIKPAANAPRHYPGRPAAARQNGAKALAAAASLSEPITPANLGNAIGMTTNLAGSYLFRWLQKKWMVRSTPGEYHRTAAFPSTTAPVPVPKPAPRYNKAELERKLEDALKGRDRARETGREEMAEIYQRDIDKIQSKLESLS